MTIARFLAVIVFVLAACPANASDFARDCANDPFGVRFVDAAKRVRHLKLDAWLNQIHMKGLTFPIWTPIDPLQHLDVLRSLDVGDRLPRNPHPKQTIANQIWQKDRDLLLARIKSGDITMDETSMDDVVQTEDGDLGKVTFIRVSKKTLFVDSVAGLPGFKPTPLNGQGGLSSPYDLIYVDRRAFVMLNEFPQPNLMAISLVYEQGEPVLYATERCELDFRPPCGR